MLLVSIPLTARLSLAGWKQPNELLQLRVTESLKWLDGVLWAQVTIGGAAIIAKLLGLATFEFAGSDVNLADAWVIFLILTAAHWYCAVMFARSVAQAADDLLSVDKKEVFLRVTATGGLFVRGMIPRRAEHSDSLDLRIHPSDLSGWAALIAMPLLVAAITPFEINDLSLVLFLAGLFLAHANWLIG